MSEWDTEAPSAGEIEAMARAVLGSVPEVFRDGAAGLAVIVEDLIPEAMDDGLGEPWEITGLYTGISLPEAHSGAQAQEPNAIWLFRLPILLEWAERGNVTLKELVAHVTVHELAHHFGWSDDNIAAIDPWWE